METYFRIFDLDELSFWESDKGMYFWKRFDLAKDAFDWSALHENIHGISGTYDEQKRFVIREFGLQLSRTLDTINIPKRKDLPANSVYRILDTLESEYWVKRKGGRRTEAGESFWKRPNDAIAAFDGVMKHRPIQGMSDTRFKDQSRFVLHELLFVP